jgi:hypothetical protein
MYRGEEVYVQAYCTLDWGGQLHTLLYPEERSSGTRWIGSSVGYRAHLDTTEKRRMYFPCQESSPDSLAIQPVAKLLIWLHYPRSYYVADNIFNIAFLIWTWLQKEGKHIEDLAKPSWYGGIWEGVSSAPPPPPSLTLLVSFSHLHVFFVYFSLWSTLIYYWRSKFIRGLSDSIVQ